MNKDISFYEHIKELRVRIILSVVVFICFFVVAFIFYKEISSEIVSRFKGLSNTENLLFVTSILEPFSAKIHICAYVSLILSLPYFVYQICAFVMPALNTTEKIGVIIFLSVSFILVCIAAFLAYFYLIPTVTSFLTSSSFIPEKVGVLFSYKQNALYIFNFVFYNALSFMFPPLLFILLFFRIVRLKTVVSFIRPIIIIIFILAAIVTPPDVFSQLMIGLPLVILFFTVIVVAKVFRLGD